MSRGTDVTEMKRTYRTAVSGEFPSRLSLELSKESDLRYGENPNQPAAIYRFADSGIAESTDIRLAKSGKGGLSATNMMDVTRALDILKFFDVPAVSVMKHTIPSGFARQNSGQDLATLYRSARDADARSAFGSIVVFNRPLDKESAEAVLETYVEGVAAPEYEEGVMPLLEQKKDLRVIQYSYLAALPAFKGCNTHGLYDVKGLPTGRALVQAPYLTSIRSASDLITDPLVRWKDDTKQDRVSVVARDPNPRELEDLLTAWYVNLGVRSNGIVIVKDGVTLAVGSGQQERVGAVEQAIVKAYQKALDRVGISYDPIDGAVARGQLNENPLKGAVVSSDAFFPKRDSIDHFGRHGLSAIIQPGGSIRDGEIIDAVNEYNIAMVFTLERCFGHF